MVGRDLDRLEGIIGSGRSAGRRRLGTRRCYRRLWCRRRSLSARRSDRGWWRRRRSREGSVPEQSLRQQVEIVFPDRPGVTSGLDVPDMGNALFFQQRVETLADVHLTSGADGFGIVFDRLDAASLDPLPLIIESSFGRTQRCLRCCGRFNPSVLSGRSEGSCRQENDPTAQSRCQSHVYVLHVCYCCATNIAETAREMIFTARLRNRNHLASARGSDLLRTAFSIGLPHASVNGSASRPADYIRVNSTIAFKQH